MTKEEFMRGSIFPLGVEMTPFEKVIEGKMYTLPLISEPMRIANVVYEPKSRNHWHVHKALEGGGQILIVLKGFGIYQEWQKQARFLKPGDIVSIPPAIKHWHGASDDSWCEMLTIQVPGRGLATEWGEPLSDVDYQKILDSITIV